MPSSPSEVEMKNPKSVLFDLKGASDSSAAANELPRYPKSHSQPMPKGFVRGEAVHQQSFTHHPSLVGFKDKRFDSFKTFSGRLERQLTNLRGKSRESGPENSASRKKTETETNVPVDRYFDALQGPELDTLRVCVYTPCMLYLNFSLYYNCSKQICWSMTGRIITITFVYTAFRGDGAS